MIRLIKKLVVLFFIFGIVEIFNCSSVFATENTPGGDNIIASTSQVTVATNKVWKVTFDDEIDDKTIDGNVMVLDKATNKELEVKVSLENNNKTIVIASDYSTNSNYSLVINKNLKSKNNKGLKAVFSKDFNTDSLASTNANIYMINDITISIEQNESFALPATVDATMSDGTSSSVTVSWDKLLKDTSSPGEYKFYGTVYGYEKKVVLTLTIKDKTDDTANSNNADSSINESNTTKDNTDINEDDVQTHSQLQKSLHTYLSSDENRQSVMERAIELHGGDASNTCVYFASEALRRAGMSDLPEDVCNTLTLTKKLEEMNWQKSTDLSQLLPGDICFTISYGYGPTHTYTFMKWLDPTKYDYAYICDNQVSQYGDAYHVRNINIAGEKDPISYFMYKSE